MYVLDGEEKFCNHGPRVRVKKREHKGSSKWNAPQKPGLFHIFKEDRGTRIEGRRATPQTPGQ